MRLLAPTSVVWVAAGWLSLGGCAVEGDIEDPEDPGLEEEEHYGYSIDPIVFVHGCTTPDATDQQADGLWEPMKAFARSQGYPDSYLVSWVNTGPQCNSNWAFAQGIRDKVNQVRWATGRSKVDIVAHSMGSLAVRLYISQYGGSYYVDDAISIGGGDHGGGAAAAGVPLQQAFGYPFYEGMQEMFPVYACQGQTSGQPSSDVQYLLNGCLTPWGRSVWRDETPGYYVNYRAIQNRLDEVATPWQTGCLNQRWQNDCASSVNFQVSVGPGPGPCGPPGTICPAHLAQLWDPVVMDEVIDRTSDRY